MATRAIAAVAILSITAGGLAGCATAPPPVNVVADSFCRAAKKRTWSVDDTPTTIQEAITQNAGIDRRCGPPSVRLATK